MACHSSFYWCVDSVVSEVNVGSFTDDYILDVERGILTYVRPSKSGAIIGLYNPNRVSVYEVHDSAAQTLKYRDEGSSTVVMDIEELPEIDETAIYRDDTIDTPKRVTSFKLNKQNVYFSGIFGLWSLGENKQYSTTKRSSIVKQLETDIEIGFPELDCDELIPLKIYENRRSDMDVEDDVANTNYYEKISTYMDLKLNVEKIKSQDYYESSRIPKYLLMEHSVNLAKNVITHVYVGGNTAYIEAVWMKFFGTYDANAFHVELVSENLEKNKLRRMFMNDRLKTIFDSLETLSFDEGRGPFGDYVEAMLYRTVGVLHKICENDSVTYLRELLVALIKHRSEFLDLEDFDPILFLSDKHRRDANSKSRSKTTNFEEYLKNDLLESSCVPTDFVIILVVAMLFKIGDFDEAQSSLSNGLELLYEGAISALTGASYLTAFSCYPNLNDHVTKRIIKPDATHSDDVGVEYSIDYESMERSYVKYNAIRRLRMRLHDVFGKSIRVDASSRPKTAEFVRAVKDAENYNPVIGMTEIYEKNLSDTTLERSVDENALTTNSYDDLVYCSGKLYGYKRVEGVFDTFGQNDVHYIVRILLNAWCCSSVFDEKNVDMTFEVDLNTGESGVVRDSVQVVDGGHIFGALQRNGWFDAFEDTPSVRFEKALTELKLKHEDAFEPVRRNGFNDTLFSSRLNAGFDKDVSPDGDNGEDRRALDREDWILSDAVLDSEEYLRFKQYKRACAEGMVFNFADERLFKWIDDKDGVASAFDRMRRLKSSDDVERGKSEVSAWENAYWVYADAVLYAHFVKPSYDWLSPLANVASVLWVARDKITSDNSERFGEERLYSVDTHGLLNVSTVVYEKESDVYGSNRRSSTSASFAPETGGVNVVRVKTSVAFLSASHLAKYTETLSNFIETFDTKLLSGKFGEISSSASYRDVFKSQYDSDTFPKSYAIYEDGWFDKLPLSLTVGLSFGGFQLYMMNAKQCSYISDFFVKLYYECGVYSISSRYFWKSYAKLPSKIKKKKTFEQYLTSVTNRSESLDDDAGDSTLKNVKYMFDSLIYDQNPRNSWGLRKSSFLNRKDVSHTCLSELSERYFGSTRHRPAVKGHDVLYYFFKIMNDIERVDEHYGGKIISKLGTSYRISDDFERNPDRELVETVDNAVDNVIGIQLPHVQNHDEYRMMGNAIPFDEAYYAKSPQKVRDFYDMLDVVAIMSSAENIEPMMRSFGPFSNASINADNYRDWLTVYISYKLERFNVFCEYDAITTMFRSAQTINMLTTLSKPLRSSGFDSVLKNYYAIADDARYADYVSGFTTMSSHQGSPDLNSLFKVQLGDGLTTTGVCFWSKCSAYDEFSPRYLTYKNMEPFEPKMTVTSSAPAEKSDAKSSVSTMLGSVKRGLLSMGGAASYFAKSVSSTSRSYDDRSSKTYVKDEDALQNSLNTMTMRGVENVIDDDWDDYIDFRTVKLNYPEDSVEVIDNVNVDASFMVGYVNKIECDGNPIAITVKHRKVPDTPFVRKGAFSDRFERWVNYFSHLNATCASNRFLAIADISIYSYANDNDAGKKYRDIVNGSDSKSAALSEMIRIASTVPYHEARKTDNMLITELSFGMSTFTIKSVRFERESDVPKLFWVFEQDVGYSSFRIRDELRFLLNFRNVDFIPKYDRMHRYDASKRPEKIANRRYAKQNRGSKQQSVVVGDNDAQDAGLVRQNDDFAAFKNASRVDTRKKQKTDSSQQGGQENVTDKYAVLFDDIVSEGSSTEFSKTKSKLCEDVVSKVFSTYYRMVDYERMDLLSKHVKIDEESSRTMANMDILLLKYRQAFDGLVREFKSTQDEMVRYARLASGRDGVCAIGDSRQIELVEKYIIPTILAEKSIKSTVIPIFFESNIPFSKTGANNLRNNVFDQHRKVQDFDKNYESAAVRAYERCKRKYLFGLEGSRNEYFGAVYGDLDEIPESGVIIPVCFAVLPYVEFIMTTNVLKSDTKNASYDAAKRDLVTMSDIMDYDALFCKYEPPKKGDDATDVGENVFFKGRDGAIRLAFSASNIKQSGLIPIFAELYEDIVNSTNNDKQRRHYSKHRSSDANASDRSHFDDLSYVGVPVWDYAFALANVTLANKHNVMFFLHSRIVLPSKTGVDGTSFNDVSRVVKSVYAKYFKDVFPSGTSAGGNGAGDAMVDMFNFFTTMLIEDNDGFESGIERFVSKHVNVLYFFEYNVLLLGCVLIVASPTFAEHVNAVCAYHSQVVIDNDASSMLDAVFFSEDSVRNLNGALSSYFRGFETSSNDYKKPLGVIKYAMKVYANMICANVGSNVRYFGDREKYDSISSYGSAVVTILDDFARYIGLTNDNPSTKRAYDVLLNDLFGDDHFELYFLYVVTKMFGNTITMSNIGDNDAVNSKEPHDVFGEDVAIFKKVINKRLYVSDDSVGFLKYESPFEQKSGAHYFFRWCDVYDDPNLRYLKSRCVRSIDDSENVISPFSKVAVRFKEADVPDEVVFSGRECVVEQCRIAITSNAHRLSDAHDMFKKLVANFSNSETITFRRDFMKDSFLKTFLDTHPISKETFDMRKFSDAETIILKHIVKNDDAKDRGWKWKDLLSLFVSYNVFFGCYSGFRANLRLLAECDAFIASHRSHFSKYAMLNAVNQIPGFSLLSERDKLSILSRVKTNAVFDYFSKTNEDRFKLVFDHKLHLYGSTTVPSVLLNGDYYLSVATFGVIKNAKDVLKAHIVYSDIPISRWKLFHDTYKDKWTKDVVYGKIDAEKLIGSSGRHVDDVYEYNIFAILYRAFPFALKISKRSNGVFNGRGGIQVVSSRKDRVVVAAGTAPSRETLSATHPVDADGYKDEKHRDDEDDLETTAYGSFFCFNVVDITGFKYVLNVLLECVNDLIASGEITTHSGGFSNDYTAKLMGHHHVGWPGRIVYGSRMTSRLGNGVFGVELIRLGVKFPNDETANSVSRTLKPYQKACYHDMVKKRGLEPNANVKLIPMVLPVGSGKTTIISKYLDFMQKNGFTTPYVFYVTEIDAVPSLLKELWTFGVNVNIVRSTSESSGMNSRIVQFVSTMLDESNGKYYEKVDKSVYYDDFAGSFDGGTFGTKRDSAGGYSKMDILNAILSSVFVNGSTLDLKLTDDNPPKIKTKKYEKSSIYEELDNFMPFFVNVVDYSSLANISDEVWVRLNSSKFHFCDYLRQLSLDDYSAKMKPFAKMMVLLNADDADGDDLDAMLSDVSNLGACDANTIAKNDRSKGAERVFEKYFGTIGYMCIFDEYHGIMRSKTSIKREKTFTMLKYSKESVAMTGTPIANSKSAKLLMPFMANSVNYPITNDNLTMTLNSAITAKVEMKHEKKNYVVHVSKSKTSVWGVSLPDWVEHVSNFYSELSKTGSEWLTSDDSATIRTMLYFKSDEYGVACNMTDVSLRDKRVVSPYCSDFSTEDGGVVSLNEFFYDMSLTDARHSVDTETMLRSKNAQKIYEPVYKAMFCVAMNEISKGNRVMLYVRFVDHLKLMESIVESYLDRNAGVLGSRGYELVRENELDRSVPLERDRRVTYYLKNESFDYVHSDVQHKRYGLVVLPMTQRRGFNMTGCNVQVLTYYNANTSELEQANGRIDRVDQTSKEIKYYHVFNDRLCLEYVKNIQFKQCFK